MLTAVSRLIATFHMYHPADQGSGDRGLPPASPRCHSALTAVFGLFAVAGAWVLLTEFGEAFAAQVCYRHGMAPDAPQWLVSILSVVSIVALLIGLAGAAAAWRHWRIVRDQSSGSARPLLDVSLGRRRYVAMAALLLSLLFLVGLAAAGLAVLLVSPCSAWR